MNKIYRIKSSEGGLSVCLYQIVAIRYTTDGSVSDDEETRHSVEIVTDAGSLDANLATSELEALQKAWNEAL